METWNCQYVGNTTVRYEVEIWYVEVTYDVDFDYGVEI